MSILRTSMNLSCGLNRLGAGACRLNTVMTVPVRSIKIGPKGTYVSKLIPTMVKLEAGKKYSWCKCGLSKKQPFCDGAHKPTEFKPVRFEVEKSKSYLMCRCKQTSNQPFCDFTHVKVMVQAFTGQLKDKPLS
ncbi:CDGSH iron-sulfur domain-containing protein 3, mitochondrial-like [Strongylocentrotus purpuratus]|uniref:Iron-binding zinc finger CDGSH type domain-containing protein n=1 Tax=Strongylocentrotus purpuratus TaxID=7668 RepID=A0A7M7N1Y3_STRPU|nr:CDGSH iron-sulfur domain-containing protein 3, mitochondrial-like [Strongylocentrotus purpuratus]